MFDTSFLFHPSRMTILMDGGAGSSGKGKLASFIGEHAGNWQFCCNAFMSNAAHWVVLDDGTKLLYQSLNSVAHLKNKYEKMYICGGAVLELAPLLREIKEHSLSPHQLGINPLVAIVQSKDIDYERGIANFEGERLPHAEQSDCMKLGSTLHGVGAARARRILRRADALLARQIPELEPYICWTDREIVARLESGQSGLLEIAQGYQLGYLTQFYPRTTSRNCTVAAGLDDCGIPPRYAGDVVLNFRTFPIRVNSNKYVNSETGDILTSDEMDNLKASGKEDLIKIYKGDSGGCYDDQAEITWDEVSRLSGIKLIDPQREIREKTSLTKLERRVYTFSTQNLLDAIKFNATSGDIYVSINFINYVDASLEGARGGPELLTPKAKGWLDAHATYDSPSWAPWLIANSASLKFLGTGARTNDMLVI